MFVETEITTTIKCRIEIDFLNYCSIKGWSTMKKLVSFIILILSLSSCDTSTLYVNKYSSRIQCKEAAGNYIFDGYWDGSMWEPPNDTEEACNGIPDFTVKISDGTNIKSLYTHDEDNNMFGISGTTLYFSDYENTIAVLLDYGEEDPVFLNKHEHSGNCSYKCNYMRRISIRDIISRIDLENHSLSLRFLFEQMKNTCDVCDNC